MPGTLRFKALNRAHRALLLLSGGRLGWQVQQMPVLELTTTGRRSGRPHTVLLTSPMTDGADLVVVASRGGDDGSPAWLLNLQADPDVRVAVGGATAVPMRARVANPDERARLWPQIVAEHPIYDGYQDKTSRLIPLVFLQR